MASIKENRNKDGQIISYRIRVCVGRNDAYRQIFKTTTLARPEGLTPAKERREVERLAAEWEKKEREAFEQGRDTSKDRDKITLKDFIEKHWFPDCIQDGQHTPATVDFMRYMSADILAYFGPRKQLSAIDTETVKRYIKYLNTEARTKNGEPYSATTVQHHYKALRNIVRYAVRVRYLADDPFSGLLTKEKPHKQKKSVDFLEPEKAQEFMRCLETETLFWRCFLSILILCGLRRGECVGLQWGDLDGKKLTLTVSRNVTADKAAESKIHIGDTKTGESRTVPVTPRLYALLMDFKREQAAKYGTLFPKAFIFCNTRDPYRPIYPTVPTRFMRRFIKRHNLPDVSPHDLRHTAASLALESGASLKDVQGLLGHQDASTTMAFYIGLTEKAQRRTVEGTECLLYGPQRPQDALEG